MHRAGESPAPSPQREETSMGDITAEKIDELYIHYEKQGPSIMCSVVKAFICGIHLGMRSREFDMKFVLSTIKTLCS